VAINAGIPLCTYILHRCVRLYQPAREALQIAWLFAAPSASNV